MKKSLLMIPIAASVAALLLIAAAAKSHGIIHQPDPYSAVSWLTAIMAFGVFVVMLVEYFIHGRQIHLYLGGAFLAVGIMGIWDALTFPYEFVFRSAVSADVSEWQYLTLWEAEWITLALMLLYGLIISRRSSSKDQVAGRGVAIVAGGLLWAAVVIFVTSMFEFGSESSTLWPATTGMIVAGACAVIFAVACFAYSRSATHKGNAVLAWMAYGLVFAALAQAAMALREEPGETLFWFASLMKVLVLLSPLAGMLAEHTRLQVAMQGQASELGNLIQTQQAVSSIASPAELFQRIVELASLSLKARAACLMPFEKERGLLRMGAQVGFGDDAAKRLVFRPGEGPVGDSFSTKDTVFVRNVLDDPVLFQKLDGVSDIRSAVFTPLIVRDECLGVLAVFFGGRPLRAVPKEQLRVLDALANQAALAVEGFQLRDRMLDSARTSDDYAQELDIVREIGQAVASKLELGGLVDTLAEKLKAAVGATACSIVAFEPDLSALRIMGQRELTRRRSVPDHTDQCEEIALTAVQRDEPTAANDIPNSRHCKYPEMASEDGGTHHAMAVPMSLPGFIGAISVLRQNAEPFGEWEKRLLMRLAPIVAAGVSHAELYAREKSIAESLKNSLFPEPMQQPQEIQVTARYQAAYDESLVGGDFYDVRDLGEGRYGIAIGDVAGKGVDAAAHTAVARYMIQSYAADDPDPVHLVSKLNSALCSYTPSGKFVTLVYGVLDVKSNTFTYVNAGHEVPFVHRGESGKLESLASNGPAAGALADGEYRSDVTSFEPGDTLIFYTDGATEARSEGKFLGTEGLQKIVADQIKRSPDNLPDAMLAGIRSYAKGHLRDDVAILVIKARVPGALF